MGFPSKAAELYSRGEIGLLRKIAFSHEKEIRPLGYYVGMVEDACLGPLTSVVSGGLFLLFSLWFLQGASSFKFGAVTFLYLILSRFQVLFYPPFGDALFGVLSEPLWLAHHHWDWIGLLQQKTYALGGPLQYPESIYPQVIALLMYFAPSPQAFILMNHLIVFAAGAILVAALREILLEIVGAKRATLGTILFLALPLIQAQVELLNMEIVCACFAVASLLMAIRKNFFMASAMAIFSAMVKLSGGSTVGMLLGACLLSFSSEPNRKIFGANIAWVIGACSVAFFLLAVRFRTIAPSGYVFNDWGSLWKFPVAWVFLSTSVLYFGRCLFRWISDGGKGRSLSAYLNDHYKGLAILGMVACWFLSSSLAPCMIPRYMVLVTPFVLLFFVYLFSTLVKKEDIFTGLMAAMILFLLLCSHGLLFKNPKLTGVNAYERSLEYRNALKVYQGVATEVERNIPDFAIVGDILMAQMLAFSEAGYVSKPLKHVVVYGSGATHDGIGTFDDLSKYEFFKVIFVAETSADPYHLSNFPIGSKDRIVKEIWAGDKRMTFFVGGFAVLDWVIKTTKTMKSSASPIQENRP